MSSEIYEYDECFFIYPFSPFNDSSSSIDILQSLQEQNYTYNNPLLPLSSSPPLTIQENLDTTLNTFDEIDQNTTTILSSSPPSDQLGNLSLYQMGFSVTSSNDNIDFSSMEVKTEESQLHLYGNRYYGGADSALKMMQRSCSSNSFQHGKSNSILYQPNFDGLIENPNLSSHVLASPDHSYSSTHMRRVCSTGDLNSQKLNQTSPRLSSSPLATQSSFMEEANFKVGRYNADERKEKILKYRAKRTQRNFNKTIKYACRKTLADNRPRIRGRFARNDEPIEIPKATSFNRYRDEDELWMDEFHEDGLEGMTRRGQFFNSYPTIGQFQQFSFIRN